VKIIALLAVMAMLLLSVAMPNSSVGGPLTIMLILFLYRVPKNSARVVDVYQRPNSSFTRAGLR
jgi:hypothetical protein